VDPRSMRPSALCRALNSTPLGEVINDRKLRSHRTRAGLRIAPPDGDDRKVDLLRYAAWLVIERHAPREAPPRDRAATSAYEAHRERAAARGREQSRSGRDIGPLPDVHNRKRRKACERDLRRFCQRYLRDKFHLAWSDDQLEVIARIEDVVLRGGRFAFAMPRGSGKTSLIEAAAAWAQLYGHRLFVVVIGSDKGSATDILDTIKTMLEQNDRLLEDFPEVCHPIRALDGIYQRAGGQMLDGERTYIEWTEEQVVLPRVEGSQASSAIIRVAGLTGRIRGLKYARPDGRSVRPDLVLVDDPQTDESAHSPSQTAQRERLLSGAVLGLAGPTTKIAALATVTVIAEDDLADRLLDPNRHPSWQGKRMRLVHSFPDTDDLWGQYAEKRREALIAGDSTAAVATRFYRRNRKAMDKGAVVAWPARRLSDELSAVQHAMNLMIDKEDAFWCEYQNEPPASADETGEIPTLDAETVAAKTNGYARELVPMAAQQLTAFIDVQGKCLFWLVAAWEEDFTGYVVDYGTEPEQPKGYFTLRQVKRTLAAAAKAEGAPAPGLEGAIYGGLQRVQDRVLGREWRREDGAAMRIERCLIDAGWGASTDVVEQFCRQSPLAGLVTPSFGRYIGAASRSMLEYSRKRGERVGLNWRLPPPRRSVRYVLFDSNYWKSFVHERLETTMGDRGCLSIFGRMASQHRMLADHLTAESRFRTRGRDGREMDEWRLSKAGADNHWLDCVVGAAVAASIQGVTLLTSVGAEAPGRHRSRLKLSALQAKRSR